MIKNFVNFETGRFLQSARLRAGLTHLQVSEYLKFDVYYIESGLVTLPMVIILELLYLYKFPLEEFQDWLNWMGSKTQEIRKSQNLLH